MNIQLKSQFITLMALLFAGGLGLSSVAIAAEQPCSDEYQLTEEEFDEIHNAD